VRRILRVKFRLGLFDPARPLADDARDGLAEHRAIAREAVRKSLVLLKNDGVLPLRAKTRVLVAGPAADDIGLQSGGWTLSWQGEGNTNADFPMRSRSMPGWPKRCRPPAAPPCSARTDASRKSPTWPWWCLARRPMPKAWAM
jgi:beta-glucosidase-like glycosyl hydrolase